MDILAALRALRAGADRLRPRWPVFDLAFTAYWSAVHPGEPLPKYRGSRGLNDTVAETAGSLLGDLGEIAAGAADFAAPGAGAAAGLGVFGVRRRRVSEAHLNMMIHFMPNVLFVLTGRDRLDWHKHTRADLPYRGSWTWPDLVPGARADPRQHLVGNLSRRDTKELIRRGRRLLQLSMSDEIVDELATASHGLPQYLELALEVAISIKDTGGGRQLEVADVTGSLDSLVMRVLDDIPADEQQAIRAACLFRIFDTDLVATAAAVDNGCAERAVLRPMIASHDGERFPYRMHDAVRDAIRGTGHRAAGGWSKRDWQLAAGRAAMAARDLHDSAKKNEDNREVLDAIGIAIGLVCDQVTTLEHSSSDDYSDWLSSAIAYSPSIQGLRSRIPGSSKTAYGQHVVDFITAKSIETPFEERLQLLRQIFDSDHPLRFLAGRHLGYTLRPSAGRWDDALAVFDELIRLSPSEVNLRQRPITLSLARRFAAARDAAEGTDAIGDINRVAEYAHGRPRRYFDEIDNIMEKFRATGHQREYLEEQGEPPCAASSLPPRPSAREIDELREEAELSGHTVANSQRSPRDCPTPSGGAG